MEKQIREHIYDVLERRGHTVYQAERAAGMSRNSLSRFMKRETLELSRKNCALLAEYLGMDAHRTRCWILRDAHRIKKQRKKQGETLANSGILFTCWGKVPARVRPRLGCKECPHESKCRAEVARGRPLLCEKFLPREVISAEVMQIGR